MNTIDYKDLQKEAEDPVERPFRWGRWLLAGPVILLLVVAAIFWFVRKTVAEQALASWCEGQQLVCEGHFDQLGAGGGVLSDLVVKSGDNVPFQANEVTARLSWNWFSPSLTQIEVDAPILRGTLDDQGIRFHGLERIGSGNTSEGGAADLPAVRITDGRLLLQTSAGEIAASINVKGVFPKSGTVHMVLDPVSLDGPQGKLIWSEGSVNIVADNGRLEGQALLDLDVADIRGISVRDADLSVLLSSPIDGEGETRIVWDAALLQGSWTNYSLQAAETSGEAYLSRIPDASGNGIFEALETVSAEIKSGAFRLADYAGDAMNGEADLKIREGILSGPYALSVSGVEAPQGRARILSIAGDIQRDADALFETQVNVTLTGASASDSLSDSVTSYLSFPGPLSDHGASLRRAVSKALQQFDVTFPARVTRVPNELHVAVTEAAALSAVSGLRLTGEATGDAPWLSWDGEQTAVNGHVTFSGGGVPKFDAVLNVSADSSGISRLGADALSLAPWRAGGKTLSAKLDVLEYQHSPQQAGIIDLRGQVGFAGDVSGVTFETTSLKGDLRAEKQPDGWQLSAVDGSCAAWRSQGLSFGAIRLTPFATNVCPVKGVFATPGKGGLSGAARLGALKLPLELSSGGGEVIFSNARMDWNSAGGLSLSATADHVSMPLTIGSNTLGIEGDKLRMGFAARRNAPPALSARLGETDFSGSLIPAKVTAGSFSFDGVSATSGIRGNLEASGVNMRDLREDPLYQPLTADFTATLDDGLLDMSGPLRLKAGGLTIADSLARINIVSLTGMAAVTSRPLTFEPGGLQPWRLSDRLRGVFTDARGTLDVSARMDINSGKITGTGQVAVGDFGFQTTRLGRVQNVNGEVIFSDLLGLTTAPGQTITIGAMNPGIPLENGQIDFQLISGKTLSVESAAFPFAGGALALDPFKWVLGGEDQHLEVTADKIELARLVETLKLPDTKATGTVSGRFPIDVQGTQILIRDARLKADANGGRLSYQGEAGDSAAGADPNARMAFEALKDFDFTVLEVGLDGNALDRITISLLLEGVSRKGITYGKNGQVLMNQPFQFDISVNSALSELFKSTQYYTSQKQLTDIVVKQVQEERNGKPE
ncbi:intermembrane phospholipid transport protein YdbH family protein [Hyphomonas pacifica]|uniref:intermembrane phospholipid transport protein YdbH family protein n=1 Tax=Hyphomonas pacifica TaxID=1280941 RepID=UPI000DBFCF94|nr:YdbH domain-containing protein [Hyphomonas pacifica]RAN36638.1 hypothetical protein HY11_11875 [Hyphomonas pacifica]